MSARGRSGLKLPSDWQDGEAEPELEQEPADWSVYTSLTTQTSQGQGQTRAKQACHVTQHTSLRGVSPVWAKDNHTSDHRSVTMTTKSSPLPGHQRLCYPVTFLEKTAVHVTLIGKLGNFKRRHIYLQTPPPNTRSSNTNNEPAKLTICYPPSRFLNMQLTS